MKFFSAKTVFLFIFQSLILNLTINQLMKSQDKEKEIQGIIEQVKSKYAPDKRVAIFNISHTQKENEIILKGETNLPIIKTDLKQKLDELKYKVKDSIKILPAKDLGEKIFGVINISVANIRTKPNHPEELATQALLGTPVKVYKKLHDGWYLIQTPDDYIAWAEDDAVQLMNKIEYEDWIKSNKIIFNVNYGVSYLEANENSQIVSDLVRGDLLKILDERNGFFKVEYPDKRTAFVPAKNCQRFDQWLNNLDINESNIVQTAKTFMGIPYLWGGTSMKGVDCSGFTKSVYYLNGILLPRDASQQVNVGELVSDQIDFAKFKPGDLLFFGTKANNGKKEKASHVGIYIGDGKFIHSSGFVRINSLDKNSKDFSPRRFSTFLRAKRILTSLDKNGVYLLKNQKVYNEVN
ncbi:MAG: C40 family peptidase [Ignavibacteriales bacterium]|nr:C40 family peptidase [Ignavibacteriales bacterium]